MDNPQEQVVQQELDFSPDTYPSVIFPNWFTKVHVEEVTGHNVTDDQFKAFKDYVESNMCDTISQMLIECLNSFAKEKWGRS